VPCVAVPGGQVESGDRQRPRRSPTADDDLACFKPRRAVAFHGVGVGEPGRSGLLVDGHPGPLEIVAQQRVPAHILGHVTYARHQLRVVERRLTPRDPVKRELPGLADQPRRLGERADRHGPVVRGHSAELIAGDQRRRGTETGSTKRRHDAGRSCADDHDVEPLER
jgi:hypothetical protein